jgi:hypothetical protein
MSATSGSSLISTGPGNGGGMAIDFRGLTWRHAWLLGLGAIACLDHWLAPFFSRRDSDSAFVVLLPFVPLSPFF